MFKSISLKNKLFKDYNSEELTDLSKVNLFIGQNNSGKSRLIRNIFKLKKIQFTPSNIDLKELNQLKFTFSNNLINFFKAQETSSQFYTSIKAISKPLHYIDDDFNPDEFYKLIDYISTTNIDAISLVDVGSRRGTLHHHVNVASIKIPKIKKVLDPKYKYQFENLYFPSLRGLRSLDNHNDSNPFLKRTIQDYFNGQENLFRDKIYTGQTLYSELKKLLLGRHEQRKKVSNFEKFLSLHFFKGKSIDLIPNISADVVYIKIGDEPDYPIYDLGDGLQMIIILTYPLFFNSEKNLKVYIEEPELFLHPGMQRILLDSLTSDEFFPNHQFFISTHSNHFLDMTADFDNISVYSLKKDESTESFHIKNVENSDTDVLNEIGVKNSSVFLSNCTIWVEGITDRIYIRKYLELYFKHHKENTIKEDLHYSFVEYGGGNITHWSFLEDDDPEYPNINIERLCSTLFLISDKDGAGLKIDGSPDSRKKKKTERHKKLEDKLANRYYCLESREIENLLSPQILEKTIKLFEKENSINLNFDQLNIDKYKSQPLGKFIDNNIDGLKRTYVAESGTVNQKLKFAKRAVSSMNSFSDLSEEAKDLCEKLHQFISNMNSLN